MRVSGFGKILGIWLILVELVLADLALSSSSRVSIHTKNKLQSDLAQRQLQLGDALFIRIFKQNNLLELWIKPSDGNLSGQYTLFRSYAICRYSGTLGPKVYEGDKQAPEGVYQVRSSQMNPNSRYHLSFDLGFPNRYDRDKGRTGGLLMVHGSCDSVGCYAIGNAQIEEVYYLLEQFFAVHPDKTVPVYALPFRLNPRNLANHQDSRWHDFWQSLKPIDDYIEQYHRPPQINQQDGRYQLLEAYQAAN